MPHGKQSDSGIEVGDGEMSLFRQAQQPPEQSEGSLFLVVV